MTHVSVLNFHNGEVFVKWNETFHNVSTQYDQCKMFWKLNSHYPFPNNYSLTCLMNNEGDLEDTFKKLSSYMDYLENSDWKDYLDEEAWLKGHLDFYLKGPEAWLKGHLEMDSPKKKRTYKKKKHTLVTMKDVIEI